MEDLIDLLKKREAELLRMKKEKEKSLKNAPEGSLRICSHGKRTQFYKRTDPKDCNGVYIPEKDFRIAQKLAQKDYDKKVLNAVDKELNAIWKYKAACPEKAAEDIYEGLHRERQKIIMPVKETEEQFIKRWQEMEYKGKPFYGGIAELYTAKGERVRSKSEVIIADLLSREGVPYRYEYPLYLNSYGEIYPDFTVLNVRTRKEMYWEHFGMMDEPEYAESVVQKIITYGQNGLLQGEHLIFTYETSMKPLNQKQILPLIQQFLK